MTIPRGRYAPSPTGELHLGNASSALLAWLSVRSRGGNFVMRVEDIDRNRSRAELVDRILDDLRWLGLDWDEGPDVGGPHTPYEQWPRRSLHAQALTTLKQSGRVYPCFCSRRDIASAASAPQTPGDELRYPGTCRGVVPGAAARRIESGDRHAWRFRVPEGAPQIFDDLVHGPWGADSAPASDFIVFRGAHSPAYQLAVVVDDAAMGIDEVVRGDDLLTSTQRQLLLYEALGLPAPAFGHVPLLFGPDGARLSKRQQGITIRELRARGFTADDLVGRLAHLLSLRPTPEPTTARDLVPGFSLEELRRSEEDLVIDAASWEPR